jgi:hypothetical protein
MLSLPYLVYKMNHYIHRDRDRGSDSDDVCHDLALCLLKFSQALIMIFESFFATLKLLSDVAHIGVRLNDLVSKVRIDVAHNYPSVKWLMVLLQIPIIFAIFDCLVSLMLDSDCNCVARSRISCMAPIMVPS